jgi:hypothetical protein
MRLPSLAVIAAMAFRRRFTDVIPTFETLAGMSFELFRKKYGMDEYLSKEAELLRSILQRNLTNYVVALSSSAVEEPSRSVLLEYK